MYGLVYNEEICSTSTYMYLHVRVFVCCCLATKILWAKLPLMGNSERDQQQTNLECITACTVYTVHTTCACTYSTCTCMYIVHVTLQVHAY